MGTQNQYNPGDCNIGPDEIIMRIRGGWFGLVLTILVWLLFAVFQTPSGWRLTLFFPAMISATGFIQAKMHFCVYFGFAALFNFGEAGKRDTVNQAEFRKKDRRKAWQIVILSGLIGIIVAVLGYFLPL